MVTSRRAAPALIGLALCSGLGALAPRAEACGGCMHGPEVDPQNPRSTQVTGHRMILSLSLEETTLWDQIEYAGAPAEFAWVLPIKGQVEVGLSSDWLFAALDGATSPVIVPPTPSCPACPPPPYQPGSDCYGSGGSSTGGSSSSDVGTGGSGTGGAGGGVEILVQEVVGPYETVQLSASDPMALQTWLASHGYVIPPDIQPTIDAYVNEGFGFLALRLVPGVGVQAMRPVRVSMPGASPVLPLRMVAAGTGATTAVALYVAGDGSWVPAGVPWQRITDDQLVWDWDVARSNYADVRSATFSAMGGTGWLWDAQVALFPSGLLSDPAAEISYDADADHTAAENLALDAAKLGPSGNAVHIGRFTAELSREAFVADLAFEAAADQGLFGPRMYPTDTTGTPPCSCPYASGDCGLGGSGSSGSDADSCTCRASGGADTAGGGLLVGLAGLALRRRGGRRPRASAI